jgi:ribonuclease HI
LWCLLGEVGHYIPHPEYVQWVPANILRLAREPDYQLTGGLPPELGYNNNLSMSELKARVSRIKNRKEKLEDKESRHPTIDWGMDEGTCWKSIENDYLPHLRYKINIQNIEEWAKENPTLEREASKAGEKWSKTIPNINTKKEPEFNPNNWGLWRVITEPDEEEDQWTVDEEGNHIATQSPKIKVIVYTDGSLYPATWANPKSRAGWAAIFPDHKDYNIHGNIIGTKGVTAFTTESMALLQALLVSPNTDMEVRTDCMAVINRFLGLRTQTTRERLKGSDRAIWNSIHFLIKERKKKGGGNITLTKVDAHKTVEEGGDPLNWEVDALAKRAARNETGKDEEGRKFIEEQITTEEHQMHRGEEEWVLTDKKNNITRGSIYSQTNKLTKETNEKAWAEHPTQGLILHKSTGTDRKALKRALKNSYLKKSSFTSKMLSQTLATLKELGRRHAAEFPTTQTLNGLGTQCRLCKSGENETNNHLWSCPALEQTHKQRAAAIADILRKAWRTEEGPVSPTDWLSDAECEAKLEHILPLGN